MAARSARRQGLNRRQPIGAQLKGFSRALRGAIGRTRHLQASRALTLHVAPDSVRRSDVSRRKRFLPSLAVIALGLGHPLFASAAEWEALVLLQHTSDLLRGRPLNTREESQEEMIAAGATLRLGLKRAFEIDLVHGVKSIDRGSWESGSQLTVRWYPGRHNKE